MILIEILLCLLALAMLVPVSVFFVEVLQLAHALTHKWTLSQQAQVRLEDLDRLVQQRTSELQKANERLQREIAERIESVGGEMNAFTSRGAIRRSSHAAAPRALP